MDVLPPELSINVRFRCVQEPCPVGIHRHPLRPLGHCQPVDLGAVVPYLNGMACAYACDVRSFVIHVSGTAQAVFHFSASTIDRATTLQPTSVVIGVALWLLRLEAACPRAAHRRLPSGHPTGPLLLGSADGVVPLPATVPVLLMLAVYAQYHPSSSSASVKITDNIIKTLINKISFDILVLLMSINYIRKFILCQALNPFFCRFYLTASKHEHSRRVVCFLCSLCKFLL